MDHDRRDLFPGALEMMILHILRREPLHGYAIGSRIRDSSNDLLQVEEGSLYPALQRMLKAKWVEAAWGVSPQNRRVRIYKITASGKKQLQRQVSDFQQMMEGFTRVMGRAQS